jgi:transposase
MKMVGCDLHTRYHQVAMLDQETGELVERRLEHESGEARAFYVGLEGGVRVGIEATGHTRWFERMLGELGHELWIGDAAQIRAAMVRKQKTDGWVSQASRRILELSLPRSSLATHCEVAIDAYLPCRRRSHTYPLEVFR